ncbi:MAG: tetratricopeptide repeat protein [Acidobacteria bacterium]|nr:MAG: tetratricopeptide repeat protein [Acidobacteriota bacterium]
MAQAYERLGRRDEAARELAEALRLFPGHAGAARDLARLRKG